MKIKRSELNKVLNKVKPGLASKEVIEQSTSFVFKDGQVATYNDEIAVNHPMDIGLVGAVQSKELLALLSKIRDEEINVKEKNGELIITGQKFKSGIRLEEEINLPLDFLNAEIEFKDLPEGFSEGAHLCIFSAAAENVSPVLSNIHVKKDFIESCDNFRLTRCKMEVEMEDELLISSVGVQHLVNYDLNQYGLSEGWIHFKDRKNGLVFSCRTFEEQYPNLDNFLTAKGMPIRLPDGLNDVLDRSGIFSTETDGARNLVSVTIGDNWCKVRGENEHGWFEEKIRVKTKEKTFIFMVSPKILQDILKRSNKATLSDTVLKFRAQKFDHVVSLIKPKK